MDKKYENDKLKDKVNQEVISKNNNSINNNSNNNDNNDNDRKIIVLKEIEEIFNNLDSRIKSSCSLPRKDIDQGKQINEKISSTKNNVEIKMDVQNNSGKVDSGNKNDNNHEINNYRISHNNNKNIHNNNNIDNNDNNSTRSISDSGTSDDGPFPLKGISKRETSFDSRDITTLFLSDFFYPFDGKGVLSYLGSEGKTKTYKNPHLKGKFNFFILLFFFLLLLLSLLLLFFFLLLLSSLLLLFLLLL